jgi:uncharacterized membrane protein YtjA (UPF0391 family)
MLPDIGSRRQFRLDVLHRNSPSHVEMVASARNVLSATSLLPSGHAGTKGTRTMLKWALIFFLVSIVAGIFGFTGIAAGAATIARVLFFIALAIMLVFLVLGLLAGAAIF